MKYDFLDMKPIPYIEPDISNLLFSDNLLIEIIIAYIKELSYSNHRYLLECIKFERFDDKVLINAIDYVYGNIDIINKILLPRERIINLLGEYVLMMFHHKKETNY